MKDFVAKINNYQAKNLYEHWVMLFKIGYQSIPSFEPFFFAFKSKTK